jgi:predicted dehydrogenase
MLKLAIIGAGIMGERLIRAARDHAADIVQITGVWDRDPAATARLAAALPGLVISETAAQAMASSDCVYIASPPASHLGYAETALALDKAVFCEKPLSVDFAAAKRFVDVHHDGRIGVNFPFASSFAVSKLVEWSAEIGAPETLTIDVAFRVWPRPWQHDALSWLDRRAEGGFTREVVSHFLFLSRRLLGKLRIEGEVIVQYPDDIRAEFDIRAILTAGGIETHLTGNVGNVPKDDHNTWTLRGPHGAIRLRDWSIAERQTNDGKWHADPDALPNEKMRPLVLRRQLEQVALMTRGEHHKLATITEAFEVQQIVEAILTA